LIGGTTLKTSKKDRPYSAADVRAVSDNPEWTKRDFEKAKRFDEVFPDLARTIKRPAPTRTPQSGGRASSPRRALPSFSRRRSFVGEELLDV
jgi:hypothetical protein